MASSRLLLSAGIAILIAGKFLGGCATPPPPPPPAVDEWKSDSPPHLIPNTAVRVAEGTAPLSYIPASPVTVYILDNDAHTLITTSEMPHRITGSFFVVDASEKAVVMKNANEPGNRIVLAAPVDINHRFSIWVVHATASTQP